MPISGLSSPQVHNKILAPDHLNDNSQKWDNANAKNAFSQKVFQDQYRLREVCRKQISSQGIKIIIRFVQDYDFSYIQFVISIVAMYLKPVFRFWSRPSMQIKKQIHELMVLINSKLNSLPLNFIFQKFQQIKIIYERVSKKKLHSIHNNKSQFDTEKKAHQFLKQAKEKYSKDTSLQSPKSYDQTKQPKQLYNIDTNPLFGSNWKESKIAVWREIYFKIELQFDTKRALLATAEGRRKIQNAAVRKQQGEQKNKNGLSYDGKLRNEYTFLKNIQKRQSADRDCLGCTKYFYESDDLSFPVARQAVTYIHSRKNMDNVWKEIVAYLNNKGGIILIGCRQENQKIVPNVQDIFENEKQHFQNKINSLRNSIYPAITIDKHLLIEFVPVAHDPRKFPHLNDPQWIKGGYILRLTVVPLEPHLVYFYNYKSNENKFTIYFYRQIQQECCRIQGPEIYEFMKKRYKVFGDNPKDKESKESQKNQSKDQFLRRKDPQLPALFYHNYSCRMPEKGEQNFAEKTYYQTQNKQDISEQNPLQQKRKNFNSVSLIVMDRTALPQAKKLFKEAGKHDVEIDQAFEGKQFMLSYTTFLIWHNCKFEKLQQTLKKDEGQALKTKNKKTTLLINTVKSLWIDKQLSQQHRQILQAQVKKQAKETLQFKSIKVMNGSKDEIKHYIQCRSVITAVYLYFYMNSKFKQKEKPKYKVKFDKISGTPVAETAKPDNKEVSSSKETNRFRYKNNAQNRTKKEHNYTKEVYKQSYQQKQMQQDYPIYDYTKDQQEEKPEQKSEFSTNYDYQQEQYSSQDIEAGQRRRYSQEIAPAQHSQNTYYETPMYAYPVLQISQYEQGNKEQPYATIQNGYFCYYYSNGVVDYFLPNGTYYASSIYRQNC